MQKKQAVMIALVSLMFLTGLGVGVGIKLVEELQMIEFSTVFKTPEWTVAEWNTVPLTADDKAAKAVQTHAVVNMEIDPHKEPLRMVFLGDSSTAGMGDRQGGGYVGYVSQAIEQEERRLVLAENLGVHGYASDMLMGTLQEKRTKHLIRTTDAVVITVGGNDLLLSSFDLQSVDRDDVEQAARTYRDNMREVLSTLRLLNSDKPIFVVGVYNPFIEVDKTGLSNKMVHEWNYQTQLLASEYENVVFIPIYDLFQEDIREWLSEDFFHPNHEGYQRIGERVLEHVRHVVE